MRRATFWLVLILMVYSGACALKLTEAPDVVHPGASQKIILSSEDDTRVNVMLGDDHGGLILMIAENLTVPEGDFEYDLSLSEPLVELEYQGGCILYVANGQETVTKAITIGENGPWLGIEENELSAFSGENPVAFFEASESGTLTVFNLSDKNKELMQTAVSPGENEVLLPVFSAPGTYKLAASLTDVNGFVSARSAISLTVIEPEPEEETEITENIINKPATPLHTTIASRAVNKEDEDSYWTMTLGDLGDEQKIWDIMMQPMTVIDLSGKTAREAYKLRKTPDKSTAKDNVVGEVTYQSQGVHVLETLDNGWTKVEVYNSSYGSTYRNANNGRRGFGNTAELIVGYVETSALKTITPRDDYALLIDKFTQTMYIFEDGHIIGSLLVSTGKVNSTQPWNETPAGEFVIISRSGGFWSGNMYCDMGLLLNGGCLIHEVPSIYNEEAGTYYFGSTEPQLGSKASHGCIRVQRKKNENGQNMKWLWDNLKVNTKVLVWEDSTRYVEYPADDLALYYNPSGGKKYHSDQRCSSVNARYLPLTPITYADLSDAFVNLEPCKTCGAPQRPETIRKMNQEHGYEE